MKKIEKKTTTASFLLKVKIEDSDGQIKELRKNQDFEIEWKEERKGHEIGILNPGELRTYIFDGKEYSCWPSKGQEVEFEEGGKIYRLIVKIERAKKGWFKDEVSHWGFEPVPGADFDIHMGKVGEVQKKSWYQFTKKLPSYSGIEFTQRNSTGFYAISIDTLFILVLATIYVIYKKKTKSKVNWLAVIGLSILALTMTAFAIFVLAP